jgi:hypothetical protein
MHFCSDEVRTIEWNNRVIARGSKPFPHDECQRRWPHLHMPPLDHPPSFDEEEDWAPWVLDHGLPELPPNLKVGEIVPVARWTGPRFGAVVSIWRHLPDDDDREMGVDAPFIDSEIELFRRAGGGWEWLGSGGSGWSDPPLERPVSDPRAVLIGGETSCLAQDWACTALQGFVGEEVRSIEVSDEGGVTTRDVESPFGAFVVAVGGRADATLTFRDGGGDAIATREVHGQADWA